MNTEHTLFFPKTFQPVMNFVKLLLSFKDLFPHLAWACLREADNSLGVLLTASGGLHTGKLSANKPSKMQQENQNMTKW